MYVTNHIYSDTLLHAEENDSDVIHPFSSFFETTEGNSIRTIAVKTKPRLLASTGCIHCEDKAFGQLQ